MREMIFTAQSCAPAHRLIALVVALFSGCGTLTSDDSTVVRAEPAPVRASASERPSSESSYADDTLILVALLEGWPATELSDIRSRIAGLFFDQIRAAFPDLPESRWRVLIAEFEPRISSLCRANFAAIYLKHFSHEELREIIRFYRTPAGRAYARAYPEIMNELARDPLRDALTHEIITQLRSEQLDREISARAVPASTGDGRSQRARSASDQQE